MGRSKLLKHVSIHYSNLPLSYYKIHLKLNLMNEINWKCMTFHLQVLLEKSQNRLSIPLQSRDRQYQSEISKIMIRVKPHGCFYRSYHCNFSVNPRTGLAVSTLVKMSQNISQLEKQCTAALKKMKRNGQ